MKLTAGTCVEWTDQADLLWRGTVLTRGSADDRWYYVRVDAQPQVYADYTYHVLCLPAEILQPAAKARP